MKRKQPIDFEIKMTAKYMYFFAAASASLMFSKSKRLA